MISKIGSYSVLQNLYTIKTSPTLPKRRDASLGQKRNSVSQKAMDPYGKQEKKPALTARKTHLPLSTNNLNQQDSRTRYIKGENLQETF
jgi:hypothetical protein